MIGGVALDSISSRDASLITPGPGHTQNAPMIRRGMAFIALLPLLASVAAARPSVVVPAAELKTLAEVLTAPGMDGRRSGTPGGDLAARQLEVGRDWTPHGGSLQERVTGEIVFVGYGMSAPAAGYDDWAGVDTKGRIALALDGAPPHLATARATRLDKLIAARRAGARA